jgi:hypothetical protein
MADRVVLSAWSADAIGDSDAAYFAVTPRGRQQQNP